MVTPPSRSSRCRAPRTCQHGDRPLIAPAASTFAAAKALPQTTAQDVPVTLGAGEPFTTTLTVTFYAAILITLPVLLYEIYAFVHPGAQPRTSAGSRHPS